MKYKIPEGVGPVWIRGSKHGKLVRGVLREDGKLFWAYNRGYEIWLDPVRFKRYVDNEKKAAKRFGSERAVQVVRNWRKRNPDKTKALSKAQADGEVAANTLKRARKAFMVLMGELSRPKVKCSKGEHYIKVPMTTAQARDLRMYLNYVTKPA